MKTNLLKITIAPALLFAVLSFTILQPGNGKGNKDQSHKGNGKGENGKEDRGRENDHQPGEKENQSDGKHPNGSGKNDKRDEHADNGPHGKGNSDKNMHAENGKGNMKGSKENIHWGFDDGIDWNFSNFASRKHPKDLKKVSICHQTGGSYPVNITVSENAVQAHLKHGDQIGNCNFNFGGWPKNYITSREDVYNSYENTWESMSYSEALLKIAMDKLLGVKTDLNNNRSRLSAQEIQRRELLIMDLQNNTNALNSQLGTTRQALSGINININL